MSSFGMTRRLTSLFLCLLLVFSLSFSTVSASELDSVEENYVTLDKYSFLETICGMFNSFYSPYGYINSVNTQWSGISSYDSSFSFILKTMDKIYTDSISDLGYQTTDSTQDTYVRKYFYPNSLTSANLSVSIYGSYLDNGCLDFISILNESEYKLILHTFNTFFKMMYDYNFNSSEFDLDTLSYFDKIPINSTQGNAYIGYDFPRYSYASTNDGQNYALSFEKSFITSNNISQDDYISVSSANTNQHLNFTLITTLNDYSLEEMYVKFVRSTSVAHSITTTSPTSVYSFVKTTLSDDSTGISLDSTKTYTSGTTFSYSKNTYTNMYISPKLGYYAFPTNNTSQTWIHNWGQDLIVGSNGYWDSFNDIKEEKIDIYYPPTEDGISSLIYQYYSEDNYEDVLDVITGVNTGSEKPVNPPSDDNSGDVGNFDDSNSSLKDKLDEYNKLEDELIDYSNLDSAFETFINTNDLTENAESIANVSNYFMVLWDAFGPFGMLFTLTLALGLVSYLLNL